MKTIKADIKTGEFKSVYLLCGDEDFLRKSYKNSMKAAVIGDDTMNYTYFEGKETDPDKFLEIASTMPFFSEKRCVIVENSYWFKSAANEKILDFLDNLPETLVLIFVEAEIDKKTSLYKKVKEKGYVAEFSKPSYEELQRWCLNIIGKENKNISRSNIDLFMSYVDLDMQNLRNELEKLLMYTKDKEVIESSDISAIVSARLENKVFDMIKYMSKNQNAKALELYRDLLLMKESPMKILLLTAKQYSKLFHVKSLLLASKGKKEISEILSLKEYSVGQLIGEVRNSDVNTLKNYMLKCLELEKAVKNGEIQERIAVELLITGA